MKVERDEEMNERRDLDCASPDARRLIRRAAPLAFGIFGTIEAGTEEADTQEVSAGGSGILIAPFLGITARHVAKHFYCLEGREAPRRLHQTLHAAHLFQILDPFDRDGSASSLWHVDRSWASPHTDITLLQVSAESEEAARLQVDMPSKFFEWRFSPPPIGSEVWAIGFPQLEIRPDGRHVIGSAPFTLQGLHVSRVYSTRRDLGMLNFPCFEVEESIAHGFSGGAVFYEEKLCGLISSGSSFDRRSHVASLCPLALMDYSNEFGNKTRFADLLDRGVIVSDDWSLIRNRISKGEDELGRSCVLIDPAGELS